MTKEPVLDLVIQLDGSDLSAERLNKMTIQLKDELRNLKPVSLDLKREDKAPDGTMSVEAITLGAIALAVLPGMMPSVIEYLRDWRLRNVNRSITIRRKKGEEEVEVTFPDDTTPARLQELFEALAPQFSSDTDTTTEEDNAE